MNAVGGTEVYFNDFWLGSKHKVLTIGYDKIIAYKVQDPDDRMSMPLHWFNEYFLYQLWLSFKKECKKQLTEDAYNSIIENK